MAMRSQNESNSPGTMNNTAEGTSTCFPDQFGYNNFKQSPKTCTVAVMLGCVVVFGLFLVLILGSVSLHEISLLKTDQHHTRTAIGRLHHLLQKGQEHLLDREKEALVETLLEFENTSTNHHHHHHHAANKSTPAQNYELRMDQFHANHLKESQNEHEIEVMFDGGITNMSTSAKHVDYHHHHHRYNKDLKPVGEKDENISTPAKASGRKVSFGGRY